MPIDKDSEEYKSTRCIHILTKGIRKGLQCENKKCVDSDKCKSHCRLVKKVEVEPKLNPEEKPKPKGAEPKKKSLAKTNKTGSKVKKILE
tara:strand:+ start:237 stop:506 length:270 start_codon:yes stop_codon:yes gene_type:complete